MDYRLAEESDIEAICEVVRRAVEHMRQQGIFQWDEVYPAREDFLMDIHKGQLSVGVAGGDVAVVYAVNRESDEDYESGKWKFPGRDYRVIHRLCVNPAFQHQGVAKQTLSHIEETLREQQIMAVRLDVFSQNPFALSLYRNNGYEQVGTADWRMGRFFLMEKYLDGGDC